MIIMNGGIIAVIVICSVIVAALLVVIIGYAVLYFKDPNKNRPETIDNPTGFVKAVGTNLYDGDGRLIVLKGVNLGNWFVQEGWMGLSSVTGFETGEYTQQRGMDAMVVNPLVTPEQAVELDKMYMDNFIREEDFANIAQIGMNCVRLPFTYRNIADMEANTSDESFHYLDWALDMCEKYHLYAIVDLHGAYGSQNMDHHSGDDSQFNLYGNDKNEELTIKLWKAIAERYKDRKIVAAYDLLNEPRKAKYKFGGKITFDFYDKLYKAVREVETNHVIMMECFTFPFHGARLKHYNWENVCLEYHIYNYTPLTQKQCVGFYNATHNFMGFHTPVYIGEFTVFGKEEKWEETFKAMEKYGWSYTSWTYKCNQRLYIDKNPTWNWGLYVEDVEPVNLYTGTYDEIAEMSTKTVLTENAKRTVALDAYEHHFGTKAKL